MGLTPAFPAPSDRLRELVAIEDPTPAEQRAMARELVTLVNAASDVFIECVGDKQQLVSWVWMALNGWPKWSEIEPQ